MENDQEKKSLRDLFYESAQEIAFYIAIITVLAIAFGAVR